MKRKTFIKQLMAVGMSRNTANQAASMAREKRTPYFKALGDWLNFWGIFLWSTRNMILNCLLYGCAEMPAFALLNYFPPGAQPPVVTLSQRYPGTYIGRPMLELICNEGPDLNTIHHPGLYDAVINTNSIVAITQAEHAALHGGGGHE